MKFRTLGRSVNLGCARVYVRVDWNVPIGGGLDPSESLKIKRSLPLLRDLRDRGAVVLVLTHLGRPKGREQRYSTRQLASFVTSLSGIDIQFLDVDLGSHKGHTDFGRHLDRLAPGSVVLLENVRFQKGEDSNDPKLVRAYAAHADAFINDAFASSHRNHATVTGLAKALPSFAGPSLTDEVKHLLPLIVKPKKPYYALIGGAKLSTKLPVISALLKKADKIFIGGAMSHPFFVAGRKGIGKSYLEKEGVSMAKKLMKNRKIILPTDVIVAKRLARGVKARRVRVGEVGASDMIGDIGTETMRDWSAELRMAKTIVWNGPVGVTELRTLSHGSLVLGRAIAARARGKAYGAVGGGDTLPVIERTGMKQHFDWISTGGGAMLEFISMNGSLPGLRVLTGKGGRIAGIPKGLVNKNKKPKRTRTSRPSECIIC
jgi:phosphoglycerate kinase